MVQVAAKLFATAGGKNLDGISGALRAAKGICFS